MELKNYRLSFDQGPIVMGIVNVTPDSFSDGGLFFTIQDAVTQGRKMADEGAGIIDIGGESTRPFAEKVSVEEEMRRVLPVIEQLATKISIPISIDTTKAEIAEHAINAGASIINDISALRFDPAMASLAARHQVPVILMHMQGTPENMQKKPEYQDVILDIHAFLQDAIDRAVKAGISRSNLIIDPGIGFGKNVTHNLLLIKYLNRFKSLGVPILIGPSRKSFIRSILTGSSPSELNPLSLEVEMGTQAAVAAGLLFGADIVRVHNVAHTITTVNIIRALNAA